MPPTKYPLLPLRRTMAHMSHGFYLLQPRYLHSYHFPRGVRNLLCGRSTVARAAHESPPLGSYYISEIIWIVVKNDKCDSVEFTVIKQ